MGDLAGLDIGWRIRKAQGTRRAPVADALCEAGGFGQKTGKGYYRLRGRRAHARARPGGRGSSSERRRELGIERRPIADEEIIERLLYPMINEGARSSRRASRSAPGDIDVVWINGYGLPVWRGGPMCYGDEIGLKRVVARIEEFAARTGEESLRPAPLLHQLAEEGQGFASLAREARG